MSPYTDFVKKQMAVMGNSIPAKTRMKEIAKLWNKQKTGDGMPQFSNPPVKGAVKKSHTYKKSETKKKSPVASKKKTEKRSRMGPTMHAKDGAGIGPTEGNNGKMWISRPDKNNVYHWKPYNKN